MLEMPLGRWVGHILIHNTSKEHFSSSGSSRTVKGIDDFIYMHTPPCLASLLSRLIRLYPFFLSTTMILQRTLYTYGNDIWSSYLGPRMWRNIMLNHVNHGKWHKGGIDWQSLSFASSFRVRTRILANEEGNN